MFALSGNRQGNRQGPSPYHPAGVCAQARTGIGFLRAFSFRTCGLYVCDAPVVVTCCSGTLEDKMSRISLLASTAIVRQHFSHRRRWFDKFSRIGVNRSTVFLPPHFTPRAATSRHEPSRTAVSTTSTKIFKKPSPPRTATEPPRTARDRRLPPRTAVYRREPSFAVAYQKVESTVLLRSRGATFFAWTVIPISSHRRR